MKALLFFAALSLHAQISVPMNRYDRSATGANTHETVLNTANVAGTGFQKLYSYYVDGAVYAQPLYIPAVQIPNHGAHNVLYVATANDKVYAFDADTAGAPLWMRDLTNEIAGITPVPVTDITNRNDLNVVGNAGIMSTPVIDETSHVLYLLARTKENGVYVQRLHALDIATGADRIAPATIDATAKSTAGDAVNGVLRFNPKTANQRVALALARGQVVIAWASHEDIEPYHGWIMAYDAATLHQTGALCVTPDGVEGGIWQSGRGPVVDAAGNLYFEIGNGDWDGKTNFGTSVIKVGAGKTGLSVTDYFTPHDYAALNDRDADIGSTGPLLIPGTDILLCGNKKGIFYLLDSRDMGRMTPDDKGLIQALPVNGGRDLSGPAYWDGPSGALVYIWTEADFLKAFRFNGHTLEPEIFAKGAVGSKGSPGGALTVSSDGKRKGTGIVWAMLTVNKSADHGNAPGVLRAYDAETLAELWNSETHPQRDRLGTLVKFVPPVVAGGKVYAPNYDNAVEVYGMLR